MSGICCPSCARPTNSPVNRMLRSDYACESCHRARKQISNRKRRKKRAEDAGRVYRPNKLWTEAEDQALRDGAMELPGRTKNAIANRRGALGLLFGRAAFWTKAEKAFIRKWYGVKPLPWIAEKLGKPLTAVNSWRYKNLPTKLRPVHKLHKLTKRECNQIVAIVDASVPRSLPPQIREEIVSMMIVDALSRTLAFDAIKTSYKIYRTKYYAVHPEKGAPKSLDAKVFFDRDTTLGDTITSDVNMWEPAA